MDKLRHAHHPCRLVGLQFRPLRSREPRRGWRLAKGSVRWRGWREYQQRRSVGLSLLWRLASPPDNHPPGAGFPGTCAVCQAGCYRLADCGRRRYRSDLTLMDKAAIFSDVLHGNALRRSHGLPLLDVRAEYADGVWVAMQSAYRAICNEHTNERETVRRRVLMKFRAKHGANFGPAKAGVCW